MQCDFIIHEKSILIMIPKIIHYCWFGGNPLPTQVKKYIETWKKHLPDYEIREWNESNFDVNSTVWTKEAHASHKYAFVSDYVRLTALYEYGGIYLDTDVEVLRSFDSFLDLPYFVGAENTIHGINTATIGAEPHSEWVKLCLQHYNNRHFLHGEVMDIRVNPELIKDELLKNGFTLNNIECKEQFLNHKKIFNIFPSSYFSPMSNGRCLATNDTYAIHRYMSTWNKLSLRQRIIMRFKDILKKMLPNKMTQFILDYKKQKRDSFFDK